MNNIKYENICFEGGGVRGFAYVGALLSLQKLGLLTHIKRYTGASVGSLFAVLLCIGYTPDEIQNIALNLDLKPEPKCVFKKIYSLWHNLGLNSIEKLTLEFENIIGKKVDPNITLRELYTLNKKELVIIGTNLNRKESVFFHYTTFPNVKLIDALMISMSVPIFFIPQKKKYFGTDDYYIDGGVLENYPIWVFNDLDKLKNGHIDKIDRKSEIPSTTLGLKLLCNNENNNKEVFTDRNIIYNIKSFVIDLINTVILQIDKSEITNSYIKQTIPIHISNISFIDFSINRKNIIEIIQQGELEINKYFNS